MKDTLKNSHERYAAGFGMSLALAVLINSLLVILKETNPSMKSWMKAATGHHWITHAAIVISVYVVLGVGLSAVKSVREMSSGKLIFASAMSVVLGCGAILGYYLIHAFRAHGA